MRNLDLRLLNPLTLAPAALSGYFISDESGGFPALRTGLVFMLAAFALHRLLPKQLWEASAVLRALVGGVVGLLAGFIAIAPVVLAQFEQIRRFPPAANSWTSAAAQWLQSHSENITIGVIAPAVVCGALTLAFVRLHRQPK
jgi:hypothetical protein